MKYCWSFDDEYFDNSKESKYLEETKCRVCGCTQNIACPGGCYWVEEDLCSECVGKEVR